MAQLAAVLVFIFAQLVSAAHAEHDHNAQASTASCTICCFAFSDDDLDRPPSVTLAIPTRELEDVVSVFRSKLRTVRDEANFIIRGPPHN